MTGSPWSLSRGKGWLKCSAEVATRRAHAANGAVDPAKERCVGPYSSRPEAASLAAAYRTMWRRRESRLGTSVVFERGLVTSGEIGVDVVCDFGDRPWRKVCGRTRVENAAN